MPSLNATLSRRAALGALTAGAACAATIAPALAQSAPTAGAAHEPAPAGMTPDEALELLKSGNAAFLSGAPDPAPVDQKRRLEIAQEQHPFAVLVGCSDSRVPPEILFGRGLGELFIIRVAGNTAESREALGSIDYAVEHLGVPLVVVLGHERCGAVAAAVSAVAENKSFHGAIGEMIEPIIPAVLEARSAEGDLLDNAVRANIRRVVQGLTESRTALSDALAEGRVKIVGARYDLDDGRVEFFDS